MLPQTVRESSESVPRPCGWRLYGLKYNRRRGFTRESVRAGSGNLIIQNEFEKLDLQQSRIIQGGDPLRRRSDSENLARGQNLKIRKWQNLEDQQVRSFSEHGETW